MTEDMRAELAAVLKELAAATASLARVEHALLTKPRACGQPGHRMHYQMTAEHVGYARHTAAEAERLVTLLINREPQ